MKFVFSMLILLAVSSCGGSFFISNVKEYYFAISPDTSENRRIFGKLFRDFNSRFSSDVLHLAEEGAWDNSKTSRITLTEGLARKEDKLGWGKWIRHSRLNSGQSFLRSPHKLRKDIYTMDIEFDKNHFKKWHRSDDKNHKQQLKTLFLHELGHGFQLDHEPNRSSIMYKEINVGKKDYQSYYLKVEKFLQK